MKTLLLVCLAVIMTVLCFLFSMKVGGFGKIHNPFLGILFAIAFQNSILNKEITQIGKVAGLIILLLGLILFVFFAIEINLFESTYGFIYLLLQYFVVVISIVVPILAFRK
jgi:hypothetical protein